MIIEVSREKLQFQGENIFTVYGYQIDGFDFFKYQEKFSHNQSHVDIFLISGIILLNYEKF